MGNKIIMFSDSIQSGKTSTIFNWVAGKNNVAGILTPDIDGIRKLYDVQKCKYHDFETDVNELADVEVIGRFVFLKSAFKKATEILNNSLLEKPEWLIVDEIGKLELDNKGHEPDLHELLNAYSIHSPDTKILIIIRDYLLDRAIEKYNFKDAEIVNASYFKLKG